MQKFDVVVIGGGPGGYVSAIRLSQLGFNVAVIERENMGGICLNWGCIPTKALLRSAEVFDLMKKADEFGIDVLKKDVFKPNITAMVKRSRDVSATLSGGVAMLMKKNKIKVINGEAVIKDKNTIAVGDQEITAQYIVIATGARARQLKGFENNGDTIINYREALVQESIPQKMAIVGSGAIGLEFAGFFNSVGAKVSVFEAQEQILCTEDAEIAEMARKSFVEQGMQINTSVKIASAKAGKNNVTLSYVDKKGNAKEETFDKLLMAVGVVPNSENLGLDEVGVDLNDRGHIVIDRFCRTNVRNIYAIGDVASTGPALAHKASHEGIVAAEAIALAAAKTPSEPHAINYSNVPGCIYTHPQIASVGLTEKQVKDQGIKHIVGRFSAVGNGKAIAMGEGKGMMKVIFNPDSGELLGAHLIGAEVTEMIQGFTIAKTAELTELDLANTIFPHPTISEMMHEAALDALGRVIHS